VLRPDPTWGIRDDAGVVHRFWVIDEPSTIETICGALRDKPVIIADGHHRYETALEYRDQMRATTGGRDGPWEYGLIFLCNLDATDVSILPYHRIIRHLPPGNRAAFAERAAASFEVEPFCLGESDRHRADRLRGMLARRAQTGAGMGVVGAYLGDGRGLLLMARCSEGSPEALGDIDAALLRDMVVEGALGLEGDLAEMGVNILFTRHAAEAVESVDAGESAMALLVNAPEPRQVLEVALAAQKLSQKATYFYPKVLTGAVLYDLRAEE